MPAVALTDHGVMYGDMELYTTAHEKGVKPILGCEFYVHDGDIAVRNTQPSCPVVCSTTCRLYSSSFCLSSIRDEAPTYIL